MRTRFDALRKAMKALDYAFDKELVPSAITPGMAARTAWAFYSASKPPTAVLCCNDVAAVGALKTLAARGLQAGKDIALIGFDDLTICQYTQPRLTSIEFFLASLPDWPSRSRRDPAHTPENPLRVQDALCVARIPPVRRGHEGR